VHTYTHMMHTTHIHIHTHTHTHTHTHAHAHTHTRTHTHTQVSMTVGVAGSTLQRLLGLKNLPPGYCLPLDLRGTALSPALELGHLSRRLARSVQ